MWCTGKKRKKVLIRTIIKTHKRSVFKMSVFLRTDTLDSVISVDLETADVVCWTTQKVLIRIIIKTHMMFVFLRTSKTLWSCSVDSGTAGLVCLTGQHKKHGSE